MLKWKTNLSFPNALRNKGSSGFFHQHITNPLGFSCCEKPLRFFKKPKGFSQREGFFEKQGVFHSVNNPTG
jgi:hypothetical protein